MSTLTTRVGGWPLSIVRDDDGALLGHITGPVDEVPKGLRTVRVQPDGQVATPVIAFLHDVIDWQDAEIDTAEAHYREHVSEAVAFWLALNRLAGDTPVAEGMRRHFRSCFRCSYWHRALLQRLGHERYLPDQWPEALVIPEEDPDLKVALFYKGSRVRDMGTPYWSDPDPEGKRIMLVHVEAYAPWGEVLCANAPVSEVRLHPFHEVKS